MHCKMNNIPYGPQAHWIHCCYLFLEVQCNFKELNIFLLYFLGSCKAPLFLLDRFFPK